MPRTEDILRYYDRKASEYLGKYLVDGRAHTHVGLYSVVDAPEIFRDQWIRPELGESRLKRLMHAGQERAVSELFKSAALQSVPRRALDCGAGLGGSALLLAERFLVPVDALTNVPSQAEFITSQGMTLGVTHLVRSVLGDAFDPSSWSSGQPYGLIYALDSFCQMGNHHRLLAGLAHLQEAGATLAFSDHYAVDKNSTIARYFDDYWVSDISTVRATLDALESAGYRVHRLEDLSHDQMPYWSASIAYSSLDTTDRSDVRRQETLRFHTAMRSAYRSGDLRYYRIVASRT